ncbi:MAG: glycosyltransferase [Balneolaceae bacterium]
MNIKLFYHSLLSDWNHGNAHFLRGISRELLKRGHKVDIYEPADSWSRMNLIKNKGSKYIAQFYRYYTELDSIRYRLPASIEQNGKGTLNGISGNNNTITFNPEKELADADLVIVHEWTDKRIVRALGEYRRKHSHLKLLFHDTHHRSVTAPEKIAELGLSGYDGVLAFGEAIKDIYLENDWVEKAWTWHEAADTTVFYPRKETEEKGDVIWIGNWGDDERSAELRQYLLQPVKELGLKGKINGVRYPDKVIRELKEYGIEYHNWLPNYQVPQEFSKYKFTVHIPRGPYRTVLRGIPTIRPFEALACGIPLISVAWQDHDFLFRPGKDLLFVSDEEEMKQKMKLLAEDEDMRKEIARNGLETIRKKHSCKHRVDELMAICEEMEILTEEAAE